MMYSCSLCFYRMDFVVLVPPILSCIGRLVVQLGGSSTTKFLYSHQFLDQ